MARRGCQSRRHWPRGATFCSTSTGRGRSSFARRRIAISSAFSCCRRQSRISSGGCERERRIPIEVIHARMAKAADEMSHWAEYDYVVINTDIDRAFAQVRSILAAERLKRERQTGLSDFVRRLQAEL